jgi:hypothetical protein
MTVSRYNKRKSKLKEYYLNNKENFYWNNIFSKYGLTKEQYEQMLAE